MMLTLTHPSLGLCENSSPLTLCASSGGQKISLVFLH